MNEIYCINGCTEYNLFVVKHSVIRINRVTASILIYGKYDFIRNAILFCLFHVIICLNAQRMFFD